jgi:Flp pilus assembly protein TadB
MSYEPENRQIASSQFRALLQSISAELEKQTAQFAYVTRLDFLIQLCVVMAIFVVIMTLLGNPWVGVFLVVIMSGVLVALRWIQVQSVVTSIDKIKDLLR